MKKFLGIIAIMSVMILLAGCGKNGEITNSNTADREEITNSEVNECKQGCDIMINDMMSKEDCSKLCETSQQLDSNDISDCDDIEKTSGGLITKDICIQNKATQTQNPDFCEKIENKLNRDTCYIGLVEEMKDKSLCDKVKNSMLKTSCKQTEF